MKCYTWTIARYATETWIISKNVERRINAFEMWTYRRLNRIKWTEKVTNREVLKKVGLENTILLNTIKDGKRLFIRNKMRTDNLFSLAVNGKIPGKKSRGRRRLTMMDRTTE